MSDAASFVQFPHPGDEHRPRGDHMSWNTAKHGRKFLHLPGRYVADGEQVGVGEVVFWGEWEPPSRIERRWPAEGDLPRCLHTPYWNRPATSQPRQNTDPWVFGDRMLYSNCKQIRDNRPTALQSLSPGSVLCFGSTPTRPVLCRHRDRRRHRTPVGTRPDRQPGPRRGVLGLHRPTADSVG